jgi:PAS domain S-box-containing protein
VIGANRRPATALHVYIGGTLVSGRMSTRACSAHDEERAADNQAMSDVPPGDGGQAQGRPHAVSRVPGAELAATFTLQRVMDLLCSQASELARADGAILVAQHGDTAIIQAAAGTAAAAGSGEGSCARSVWVDGEPPVAWTNDTGSDELFRSLAGRWGARSAIVLPLEAGDGTSRQLQLLSQRLDAFDSDGVRAVRLSCPIYAAALRHAAEAEALATAHLILELAPVGILRATPDGRMLGANPAMEKILGYTAAELATMRFADYTHEDDLPANLTLFHEMMSGKRNSYQLEKRCYRRDGGLIWTRNTAALVATGVAGLCRPSR